jgi:hypothetical protein
LPGSQTDWTANNAEHNATGNGNNAYIQKFASAAGLLAGRFASTAQRVEQWEVWNEPNAWSNSPGPVSTRGARSSTRRTSPNC